MSDLVTTIHLARHGDEASRKALRLAVAARLGAGMLASDSRVLYDGLGLAKRALRLADVLIEASEVLE